MDRSLLFAQRSLHTGLPGFPRAPFYTASDAAGCVELAAEPHDLEEGGPLNRRWHRLAAMLAPPGANLVRAATAPYGRGLLAVRALPPGCIILSVPWHNLLCVGFDAGPSTGQFSAAGALGAWQAAHGRLPPQLAAFLLAGQGTTADFTRLMAWLLWLREHAPPAPWQHYISLLPQAGEAAGPLMTFSDQELQEVQSPAVEAAAQQHRRKVAGLHERLFCPATGQLRDLRLAPRGLPDTLWAAGVVSTRTFSVTAGRHSVSLLPPCADFANHSQRANTAFLLNQRQGAFQLVVVEDIAPGEEVCISYGGTRLNNADLLRGYGFTLPGNLNDRVPLTTTSTGQHEGQPGVSQAVPPPPSLSAPHLLAALGLDPALGSTGQLDIEGMGEGLLGRHDPEAVQQRRLLAALASLRGLPLLGGYTPPAGSSGGGEAAAAEAAAAGGGLLAAAAWPAEERMREQAAAAGLMEQCWEQLRGMPTSVHEDEALLGAAASQEDVHNNSVSSGGSGGSGRGSSGATSAISANASAAVCARLERKRLLLTLCDALRRYCTALQ